MINRQVIAAPLTAWLALSFALSGCTVNMQGSTFNTTANTNVDANVNAPISAPTQALAPAPGEDTPTPPPSPVAKMDTYQDYGFSFDYPEGLTPQDGTMADFAALAGSPEFANAKGKASVISAPESKVTVLLLVFDPATVEAGVGPSGFKMAPYTLAGTPAQRGIAEAYRDGKVNYMTVTVAVKDGMAYALLVNSVGMELEAMLDVEQAVLNSWTWK